MKHFWEKGQRFKGILLVFFAFTWWGLLYPELCFTEDTFRQVIVEDGEVITVKEACYREILDAEGDDIVIESRLLEWLEEMKWFRRGG